MPKKVKDQSGQDVLDLPCYIHVKKDEEGNLIQPKRTTRQCQLLIQQFREGQPSEKDSDKDKDKEEDDGYPKVNATLVILLMSKAKVD